MDKITSMNVFVDVVELGGFTPAAAKQGMSRAAASKHIIQLEKHLGAKLLNRTTRRVDITDPGRAYYDHCKQILSQIDEAENLISGAETHPEGVLRVNVPITLGGRHLNALICDFARSYPDVKIDLGFSDRAVNIEEEGYDLVIRSGPEPTGVGNWQKISALGFLVCASPVYLTHAGEPWTPAELKDHNCINSNLSPEKTVWTLKDRNNKPETVEVSGNFASDNCDAVREAAINHLGIAMLPMYMIDDDLRRMRLKQVIPSWSVPEQGIYAIYPRRHILSSKVQTLVNMLAAKLGDSPDWNRRLYGVVS